jgi:EAL domain-containing protein (putative c-di-GMP-specific phosphodiesterase class I)
MIREIAVPLASGLPLFLNVHPQELEEPWLVRPDDPIYAHDNDVYLEITESVPLTHFELCRHVLHEVRVRGGVHLVVDDLGAGYSNLKRILDLEPRIVKLDRGLIVGIDKSKRHSARFERGAGLHDPGASAVAEARRQRFSAPRRRVEYGQGFLSLSRAPEKPLPAVTWPPAPDA